MTDSDDRSRDEGIDGCPICRRFDDLLDIGCHLYYACHQHETTWYAGSIRFPSWRQFPEDEEQRVARWKENEALLSTYEPVAPWFWHPNPLPGASR